MATVGSPPAAGYPLGAQEGDVNLLSVPLSHNTGFTTFAVGMVQGHHLVLDAAVRAA